jgi:hypothetical protein
MVWVSLGGAGKAAYWMRSLKSAFRQLFHNLKCCNAIKRYFKGRGCLKQVLSLVEVYQAKFKLKLRICLSRLPETIKYGIGCA